MGGRALAMMGGLGGVWVGGGLRPRGKGSVGRGYFRKASVGRGSVRRAFVRKGFLKSGSIGKASAKWQSIGWGCIGRGFVGRGFIGWESVGWEFVGIGKGSMGGSVGLFTRAVWSMKIFGVMKVVGVMKTVFMRLCCFAVFGFILVVDLIILNFLVCREHHNFRKA